MKPKVYPSLFFIVSFLLGLNVGNARAGCITVSAGSNAAICVGSSAQLSASVSGGTAPYTYSWTPATGLNDPTISNPVTSPPITTSYKVYVTDATSCLDSASVTLTVNPSPVLTIKPGSYSVICIGNSVVLSVSGAVTYSWYPSTGLSCTNCSSPVATPTVTTAYNVVGTDANGCTALPDTFLGNYVMVNPLPVININPNDTICLGQSTQLSSSGGSVYLWSPSLGLSNPNISNPVASPTVTTTYSVTVTNSGGCINGKTTTIAVRPYPAPVLTISPNASICKGNGVMLSASGYSGYTWTPASGLDNRYLPNPTASPTITTTYKMVTTPDANGCIGKGQVVVSVGPIISVSPKNTFACIGSKIQLHASGGKTYSWFPSTGLNSTTIADPIASPPSKITYHVTITDSVGCSLTDSLTIKDTTLNAPAVVTSPDQIICLGNSASISASGAFYYSWYPVDSGYGNPIIVNPTVTTTYMVQTMSPNGCSSIGAVTVKVIQNCNKISGYCYIDYNQNQVKDGGEPVFPKLTVLSNSSGYSSVSGTNSQGYFLNYSDTGTIQTSIQNSPSYYTVSPLLHNSYFANTGASDSVSFALVPVSGIQDLRISMIPLSPLRLGVDVVYRLQYSNVGTDTMSGIINMKKNSRTTYKSSVPAFLSTNGDSASWSYSTLLPNETRTIDVTLTVAIPPVANLGDLLSFSCVIEPLVTDSVPADNYFSLGEQPIIGSFDPNDKTMLGGDNFTSAQLANGDFLTYLIRFQNTGNDTAFKIVVRDTLDSKLDGSTFEMVSASNDYSLSIENQKNIAWTFNNVLLPDSNVNEPASHGYVCYRIKAKSGVSAGDVISNTGHIFFDYNPDVITNTAQTSIVSAVQEVHPTASGLILYPNPAKDEFTVFSLQFMVDAVLEIYDLLGEKINSTKFSGNQLTISCKQLPAGIYFIRVNGNTGILRLIKID